jgi:hypothetical protein
VWVEDGAGCHEVTLSGQVPFALGSPVALANFPRFEATSLGTGRLRYEVRTTSSGVPVQNAGWFDTEFDVGCTPATMSDDSLRCVPTDGTALGGQYFADAQCQEPLLQAIRNACQPTPASPLYVTYDSGDPCDPRTAHVYESVPFTDPVYVQASECVIASSLPSDTDYFTQGAELPPTALAELVYETR